MPEDVKIEVIDHGGPLPARRSALGKTDPETRAELRIADALITGAAPDLSAISQIGFEAALDAMALNS